MPDPQLSDAVVTPPWIARRWRSKPEGVRDLLERGLLKGFKVGRSHWRILLSEVERYERGERQPAPAPKPARRRRTAIANIEGPF